MVVFAGTLAQKHIAFAIAQAVTKIKMAPALVRNFIIYAQTLIT